MMISCNEKMISDETFYFSSYALFFPLNQKNIIYDLENNYFSK